MASKEILMPLWYFHINFLKNTAIYCNSFVHIAVFCLNVKIRKSEFRQLILITGGDIKEIVTRHLASAHCDMVSVGHRNVLPILQIKKLRPRINI